MFTTIRSRIIGIGLLLLLCGWALVPKPGPDGDRISPLKLGLDLQGGMYLAVEIDDPDNTLTSDAETDAIDRTLTTLRNRIDEFGVREPTIQKSGNDRIIIELAGIDDPERAKQIVDRTAFLEFKIIPRAPEFEEFRTNTLARIDRAIIEELGTENLETSPIAPEVDLSNILQGADTAAADTTAEADAAGADAAESADQGAEVGVAAVPGDVAAVTEQDADSAAQEADSAARDPTQASPLLRPLGSLIDYGRVAGEMLIAEENVPTAERYLELESVRELIPREFELVWGVETVGIGGASYRTLYLLESEPLLRGDQLQDAGPATRDPTFNRPIVPFETTRRGARDFERGTSRHVEDYMAIVLDQRVQSYAVIRSTLSRRAQIELAPGADFTEAQDLALVLRAGALPMPIRIVEERSVGPSLGADSVRQGRLAFMIGIIGVVVVMIAYYRTAGMLAVGALGCYVVLMMGGLAGLDATLTLPGIAGLILSIGMAVDANVLIFERIREEVEAGKTPRTAVDAGFANALSAIVDANLTTLITGIILFQFGTGPIRGFAVTLCIGIMASFFSAVFVTRTLFMIYLDRRAPNAPVSI